MLDGHLSHHIWNILYFSGSDLMHKYQELESLTHVHKWAEQLRPDTLQQQRITRNGKMSSPGHIAVMHISGNNKGFT